MGDGSCWAVEVGRRAWRVERLGREGRGRAGAYGRAGWLGGWEGRGVRGVGWLAREVPGWWAGGAVGGASSGSVDLLARGE